MTQKATGGTAVGGTAMETTEGGPTDLLINHMPRACGAGLAPSYEEEKAVLLLDLD